MNGPAAQKQISVLRTKKKRKMNKAEVNMRDDVEEKASSQESEYEKEIENGVAPLVRQPPQSNPTPNAATAKR